MLKKLNNKKGFTLMEMLIVVAIIAVLVAVAIPTFTSALNKAKAALTLPTSVPAMLPRSWKPLPRLVLLTRRCICIPMGVLIPQIAIFT